eukprot:6198985-Pleurochrysis_carterae.AAC.1
MKRHPVGSAYHWSPPDKQTARTYSKACCNPKHAQAYPTMVKLHMIDEIRDTISIVFALETIYETVLVALYQWCRKLKARSLPKYPREPFKQVHFVASAKLILMGGSLVKMTQGRLRMAKKVEAMQID